MGMKYDINSLNEEQKKALFALEGAVLVTAGAGSGKTRLLTHRIAYLLQEKRVYPERILAITFTNKAANEMKERVTQMIPEGGRVWISTFHSMCVRILRRHISYLEGYDESFSIYSGSDTDKVIKKLFDERGIDDKDFKRKVEFHISNIKNSGKDINLYLQEFAYERNINLIVNLFLAYQAELKRNNALDFDDLLLKTHELFEKNPDVLNVYQNRFEYILVDEFQDTNQVQYQLVKMLSGVHQNVFVVGDEDQSIYSWRGAEFENIFRFTKDFPSCRTFKLERNYRSTKTIIEHANKVIQKNKQRFSKTLFTENEEGEKIVFKKCYDEQEEASFVSQNILSLVSNGAKFSDIVVLCRLNALTLPFEQAFMSYNIPHRIFGGFKFFERVEIKNLVSFLRIFVNSKDENSLLRIINFPKRGIGDAAIAKVKEAGAIFQYTLYESIKNIENLGLTAAVLSKFIGFSRAIKAVEPCLGTMGIQDFVVEVVKQFGIKQAYASKSEEDQNRIMNIDNFIMLTEEFEKSNPEATMMDYLENISLISDIDSMDESNSAVTIATVHAVKGLEFKHVFVVGLEEKCFPLSRAMENDFDLEEERRLMYVAVTRAEQRLFLTSCRTRFLYGKRENMLQSRFVAEMGLGDTLSRWENEVRKSEYSYKNADNGENHFAPKPIPTTIYKPSFEPQKAIVGSLDLQPNMKVEHPRFGIGVVESIEGDVADIVFEGFGKKSLMKHLAPLTVVEEE